MNSRSHILIAAVVLLSFMQAGCATPPPRRYLGSEIKLPAAWRPLFDADLNHAVEAALIRHYAENDFAPKVVAETGGGWLVKERTPDTIVVRGWLRLMYRRQVTLFPFYERRHGATDEMGHTTLTLRFE